MRDYLHVLDLASGHLLALDALAPGSTVFDNCPTPALYKAYNLGRGQGFSVLQILEAMRAATGFDYRYNIIGRRCVPLSIVPYDALTDNDDDGAHQTWRCSRFDCQPFPCGKGAWVSCEKGPDDDVPRLVELAGEKPRWLWHGLICSPHRGRRTLWTERDFLCTRVCGCAALCLLLHIVSTDGIITHIH